MFQIYQKSALGVGGHARPPPYLKNVSAIRCYHYMTCKCLTYRQVRLWKLIDLKDDYVVFVYKLWNLVHMCFWGYRIHWSPVSSCKKIITFSKWQLNSRWPLRQPSWIEVPFWKCFDFFSAWHRALMDSAYSETPTNKISQFIYKNYVIISIHT